MGPVVAQRPGRPLSAAGKEVSVCVCVHGDCCTPVFRVLVILKYPKLFRFPLEANLSQPRGKNDLQGAESV